MIGLDHIRLAEMLRTAGESVWPESRMEIPTGDEISVAVSIMRVRISRLLRAAAVLIEAGYASETAGIVRSIWEDAVSTAYMAESPTERASAWMQHAEKRRIYHLSRAFNTPGGLPSEIVDSLPKAIDGQIPDGNPYWSGKSPSATAATLKDSGDETASLLAHDFESYYRLLCDDTHGNPLALDRLLTVGTDTAISVTVGPDSNRVNELPGIALYGALQFSYAAHRMGADVEPTQIHELLDEFQAAIQPS